LWRVGREQPNERAEFLNSFLKRYTKIKYLENKKQKSEISLPIVREGQPYLFPNTAVVEDDSKSESIVS
jgi:SRSO17 transposase